MGEEDSVSGFPGINERGVPERWDSSAAKRPGARSSKVVETGKRNGVAGSVGSVVDRDQFDEQVFDKFERNLVRTVGHGVGGVRVDLHEQAVDAGGDRRAGEN